MLLKNRKLHRKASLKAALRVSYIVVVTVSYFILAAAIVPKHKFFQDLNMRQKLVNNNIMTVSRIWSLLSKNVVNMNYWQEQKSIDNNFLSAKDRQFAADKDYVANIKLLLQQI